MLTTYAYDGNNNQIVRTLAAGTAQAQTEYSYYDAANRKVAMVNSQRVLHLFGYDANGNQTLQKRFYNPIADGVDLIGLDGITTTDFTTKVIAHDNDQAKDLDYDAINRLIGEIDYMDLIRDIDLVAPGEDGNLTKTHRYNARGERTQTTDEENQVTRFAYDGIGRLVTTIDDEGNGSKVKYDTAGNQILIYTGQLYNTDTGEQISLAVPVDANSITAKSITTETGDALQIGWQLPSFGTPVSSADDPRRGLQTYVVYGNSSVAVPDEPTRTDLGYAHQSARRLSGESTHATVSLNAAELNKTPGTAIYFRVVSRDIAGNLAWTEEQKITVAPGPTAVAVEHTASDSLTFNVHFADGIAAPEIRYGVDAALPNRLALVDQGGGQYSASLSGLSDPQSLRYRIDWQDSAGERYQSETVPIKAGGAHTGVVSTLTETAVVSGTDTHYTLSAVVQLPAGLDLTNSTELVTAEWSRVGDETLLGSVSVAESATVENQYVLGIADDEPLAAGDYQIVLRAALPAQSSTLDIFTLTLGGTPSLSEVRPSASWDSPDVGDARWVILDGVKTPALSEILVEPNPQNELIEKQDKRLTVHTELAVGSSADYAVFYGNAAEHDHTTSVRSTATAQGFDLAVTLNMAAAEAAGVSGEVHLAWRAAGSGIEFANDQALDPVGSDYSTTLALTAGGRYDLKLYYTNSDGHQVIVDWLRVDTAAAPTENSGQSITLLASETAGRMQRTATELQVDSGLYTGPVTALILAPQELAVSISELPDNSGGALGINGENTGYFTKNHYNALNALIATNAETGIWRTFGVDANGNPLVTKEYGFNPDTYQPLEGGQVLRKSYAVYDKRDRRIAEYGYQVKLDGGTTQARAVNRFEYDWNDQITRETRDKRVAQATPRDLEIVREYNALGSLIKTKTPYHLNPDTNEMEYAVTHRYYDRLGNLARETDALGNNRDKIYDAHGRLDKEIDGEGHEIDYEYDDFDRRTHIRNDKGDHLIMKYDQRDRLIQTTAEAIQRSSGGTAENLVTQYAYDGRNNRTLIEDANGHQTIQYYDALGRVIETRSWQGSEEVRERRRYDAYGNLIQEQDGEGRTTSYHYGGFGTLTQVVDQGKRETNFEYNKLGDLRFEKGVRSGKDKNIEKQYYDNGRLKLVKDHATGVSTLYTYNVAGERMSETIETPDNAHNRTVTYQYDALGQMIRWADAVTGMHLNYQWDKAGNQEKVSTDPGYDPQFQNFDLERVLDQAESDIRRTDVNYTSSRNQILRGQLHRLDKDTDRYDRVYDLQEIVDDPENHFSHYEWTRSVTSRRHVLYDLLVDLGYSQQVQASIIDPNYQYIDHEYGYDGNNRVETISQHGVVQQRYGYDSAGNRETYTAYNDAGNQTDQITYTINGLGWVLEATASSSAAQSTWDYDKVGNVKRFVSRDGNGSLTANESYSYYENNRQYQTINHKEDGQMTTQDFDRSGRLKQIVVNGETTSTFTYNYTPDGRIDSIRGRGKKSKGTTRYQYDANDNPIYINQGKGDKMVGPEYQNLVYNNDNQILYQFDNSGQRGEVASRTEFAYANGNPVGETGTDHESRQQTQLDSGRYNLVQALGSDFPAQAVTAYTVREGDTLQSIAAAFYGNPSLWFVIAEANGLDATEALSLGQRLILPNSIESGRLTADAHQVYDQSEVVGSTLPNLKSKKKGCGNILAIIIIVVIAVVVSVLIPYLAATPLFQGLGTALAGAFGGTTVAAAELAAGLLAGAVLGAAGAVIQQGLFIALDYQDKFSWKAVAAGAVSGAFQGASIGIGEAAKGAELLGGSVRYAKTAAAALKVASVASKQLIENGKITSWTSLAAAGIGAYLATGRAAEIGRLAELSNVSAGAVETAIDKGLLTTPALTRLSTLQTKVDYISPWVQLAETAVRNDGDLQPLDWANAIGGTLSTAVTQPGANTFAKQLSNAGRRTVANLAVGGALSAFDREAGQQYLQNAIGQEVGQLIGHKIGDEIYDLLEGFAPNEEQHIVGTPGSSGASGGHTVSKKNGINVDAYGIPLGYQVASADGVPSDPELFEDRNKRIAILNEKAAELGVELSLSESASPYMIEQAAELLRATATSNKEKTVLFDEYVETDPRAVPLTDVISLDSVTPTETTLLPLDGDEFRDPLSVSMAGIRREPFSVGASIDFAFPGVSVANIVATNVLDEEPLPTGGGFGFTAHHTAQGDFESISPTGGINFDTGLQTGHATATIDFIFGANEAASTVEGFLGLGGKVYFDITGSMIGFGFGVGFSPNLLHKALEWVSGPLPVTNIGVGGQVDFGDL